MTKRADLIHPDQRLAACILLSAFDLPAEAALAARTMIAAAKVYPGVTIDKVVLGDRRAALLRARALIDDLIEATP
jgi:hypothetical protein